MPSNVTVPELELNVPPILDQLPLTVNVPVEGAVNVPLERVMVPPTSMFPVEPINVPPDMVRAPLND